jgi:hypothetical protein
MVLVLSSCSTTSSSPNPGTAIETITAASGTTQSLAAGTVLPTKLQVSVMKGQTPVSGVTVTFTAPATGASGVFATSGTPTETDITNANGIATSSTFTANTTSGSYSVSATAVEATGTVNFSLTNIAVPETITASDGSGQSSAGNSTFAAPLVATVTQGGVGVSGVPVTFTAPATGASGVFATSGTPTETDTTNANGVATSSAFTANATSGTYSVSATAVGVTGAASFSLKNTTAPSTTLTPGNYVFSLAGKDSNGSDYFVAGAFTVGVDGATITSGEQDFIDAYVEDSDPLTGTVSPSNDGTGNLLITLNTADANIGPGAGNQSGAGSGTETLVASMLSNSKAVVAEADSWATSRGTLDLQNSTAAAATPSAGYVFAIAGLDAGSAPLAMGGVINIDGSGTISGTGSIFDANDAGSASTYQGEAFTASTVSAPDSYGRVVFTLNPADTTDFPVINLAGYIVDATHIRLVETADTFNSTLAGTALGQGNNTGSFTSISGNSYVVGLDGIDSTGVFQVAGLLTAGANSITGAVNFNDLTATGAQSPDPVSQATTTYTVDPTGRVSIPVITDGTVDGADFNLQLYLDGNGNALAITLDSTDVLSGPGFQQNSSFSAGSFSGSYVMAAFGADNSASENGLNAVGPVIADGVGSFAGAVDLNRITGTPLAGALTADSPISGTFTTAASGIFSSASAPIGSGITGLDVTTSSNQDAFAYYLIDTTKILMIETDPNQLTLGYFMLQQ